MTPQSERKGAYIAARDKYFDKAVKSYIEDGGTVKEGLAIFYRAFNIDASSGTLIAKPKVITRETVEQRRREQSERQKRVDELAAKYSTSFGIPWADMKWHELPSMTRDGDIAKAIYAAGPAHVPGDGRRVSDVLATNKLHRIIDEVRAR